MITAQAAISKIRRDLAVGAVLRWALLASAGVAILVQPLVEGANISAMTVLLAVGAIWLVLSFRSVRGSRVAADSTSLIAAGQYELAEQHIAEAIGSFSIFRTMKLSVLHHLAVLRHAQNRWQESAMLCRALLRQGLDAANGLGRSSRLILAESLLELGDLAGVHENLMRLYEQRLTLREAMMLLVVQTDYLARIGAWEAMLSGIWTKVQLAELLPALPAARTQALLALAAKKTGQNQWREWLSRRVELIADVQKLCTDRPMLWEVWRG